MGLVDDFLPCLTNKRSCDKSRLIQITEYTDKSVRVENMYRQRVELRMIVGFVES